MMSEANFKIMVLWQKGDIIAFISFSVDSHHIRLLAHAIFAVREEIVCQVSSQSIKRILLIWIF
jgi:hypothetical protein